MDNNIYDIEDDENEDDEDNEIEEGREESDLADIESVADEVDLEVFVTAAQLAVVKSALSKVRSNLC